ncbi:hypothetical protein L3N51_01094 [Metallosphaera sp. J1]|uniref:hypothetical protein n=1 Tax=Metallosphaera TaxID=41980 RepID=UPI001EDEDA9E|nr:hypothetical protein [Metallosphaera javensis (ex Hofmann et al. 2022)]MCG3108806.1 hypothetical protein [Metallosphaera javensis (ex Hofmann et al. 2022)]BCS94262.1 MAG: hypothetical protein MjAS7_2870 [Metallosphaera javensis (ex Sakai et al. 2022)]
MRPAEIPFQAEGIMDALNLGISEATYLGAEFIGLTLDNGIGLILRVSPDERIIKILVMSEKELPLPPLGIFVRSDGKAYNIYIVDKPEKLNEVVGMDRKVIFVEVISGVLEDFLREALQQ